MFLLLKYRAKTLTVVRTHSRKLLLTQWVLSLIKICEYKSFTFKFSSIRTFSIVKK